MRNKYKRRDKSNNTNILDKKSQLPQNNYKNSSALDIQKIKDKKIENVIFERAKPIYKNNYLKENNNDKIKKEENLNENEKNKNKINIISNKEIHNRYKNLIINLNKDEKKNIQDNKLNDINSSKLMTFKPKTNHFYKYYKISNEKNNNKEIINSNKNIKVNNEKNDFKNENNFNNNLKYIYKKDKPNINTKEINNQKYTINIKQKKNYTSFQTESSLKQDYPNQNIKENNINNNEPKYLNKEKINANSTNEIQPKQSFKYLVHQASKSRDISNSFHRYYESRQLKSREQSIDSKIKDDTLKSEENSISKYKYRNLHLLKSFTLKANDSNSSINSNNKEIKYSSLTDRKLDSNLNNMKIINFKYNIKQKENENNINYKNEMNNTGNKEVTQNIINNNIYNTTLNFYKINNIYKSKYIPKSKYMSANNIMENDDIIYEDESNINIININTQIKVEYLNKQRKYDDANSTITIININLENILELEKRIKFLLDKINKYQICQKECYEYIIYFFDNNLYNEESKIFKHNHTKKNFLDNLKIEILCFFLCYDITFSKSFNQTAILFKTIFNIIHTNFLIFASYLINNNQMNINKFNQKHLENLISIIDQDLKVKLNKREMNDYDILQLITNNSKNINNYYKMVIDNIYGQYYLSNNNNIRFPQCLNNENKSNLTEDELLNIKSSFFFDSYRLLTNYNFEDLYEFFNIYLNKKRNLIKNQKLENNFIDNNNISNRNSKRIKLNIIENKIEKYLLPKIKSNYKYSLVLDLDETLICIKRDNNNKIKHNKFNNLMTLILRPGLLDFLHKMKKLYELILFSLGTSEYVSPIIKNIEKKEKFFEHILYREHVTYDDNGNFFKNLNLLNRDVKNILIVDDNSKNFKYHKSNGICIKPFYGDLNNDKNTLKILGNILFKIRYDADLTGDIRISLNKEKNNMLFSQIANNY